MKNSNDESNQKSPIKLNSFFFKSNSHYFKFSLLLPVLFFVLSTLSIFLLTTTYIIKKGNIISFFYLSSTNRYLFYISFISISVCGVFLVWTYSSILIQRFSVPEMQKIKIYIYFMFSLGIISNALLVMYGAFSEEIFIYNNLKNAKISMASIFFIAYIFFNLITAVFSIKIIYFLKNQNNKNLFYSSVSFYNMNDEQSEKELDEKVKTKTILIYLMIFVLFVYIGGVIIQNNQNKESIKSRMKLISVTFWICEICPYLLFIMNAFLNFSYYNEILYTKHSLNRFIDKEYFKQDIEDEDDSDEEYTSCEEKQKLKSNEEEHI